MRRCIGLDVHREFAEVAIWEDGIVRSTGRIATTPDALRLFAESLCEHDEVALEATCNTHAIVRLLERHVARVVVSNPRKTRVIAEAKVKTDKVDAQVLAQLLAAGFLPSVWVADEETAVAKTPGRTQGAHRPAADAVEEPGAGDPASQPRAPLPRRRPVWPQGQTVARRARATAR